MWAIDIIENMQERSKSSRTILALDTLGKRLGSSYTAE